MEAMPYRDEIDGLANVLPLSMMRPAPALGVGPSSQPVVTSDWRHGLPLLAGGGVTLRELRHTDAPALFAMLTPAEVSRFISPPPTTVEGFERFIAWALRERKSGEYICFAVVPQGSDRTIGLIQVQAKRAGFEMAEWGFAIGSAYWGTGIFVAAATLALDFTFTTLGVHRLEARAARQNGRGNGALRKLGAVEEAALRQSLRRGDETLDQALWSLLRSDWLQSKAVWSGSIQ